jgi:uroporphyrinogen-III synthase
MSQLIWTRAMDDWDRDKLLLQKSGHDALHLPCITLQGLPVRFPKHKPQVFVFTSSNAVRYTERHHALVNLMRLGEAVYAIGPGTEKALKDLKVHVETCEGVHTAEQFAVWLSRNLSPETHVAWPTAREPSYNLAEHLARYRIHVDVLPVYHTEKALHLPNGKLPDQSAIDRYIQSLEGIVCFASPSAVDGFIRSLTPSENRLKHELIAVVIGPTTKAAAEGHFQNIKMIDEPSIEKLAEIAAKMAS